MTMRASAGPGAHMTGRMMKPPPGADSTDIWMNCGYGRYIPAGAHGWNWLHLSAPLDQVMGWTVDFGDVKQIFKPVFDDLDHRPLYEIVDLADCDTASIAAWILSRARVQLPQLERVDLFETSGCGAIVTATNEGPALPV